MNKKSFENQVAVVTGAAMGNGWGIGKVFGREGAHVAMLDVSEEVFKAAKEFEGQGYNVSTHKVDITDFGAVKKAVDESKWSVVLRWAAGNHHMPDPLVPR